MSGPGDNPNCHYGDHDMEPANGEWRCMHCDSIADLDVVTWEIDDDIRVRPESCGGAPDA